MIYTIYACSEGSDIQNRQVDACIKYLDAKKLSPSNTIVDTCSITIDPLQRPELSKYLRCATKDDILVVPALKYLTISYVVFSALREYKCNFLFIAEDLNTSVRGDFDLLLLYLTTLNTHIESTISKDHILSLFSQPSDQLKSSYNTKPHIDNSLQKWINSKK